MEISEDSFSIPKAGWSSLRNHEGAWTGGTVTTRHGTASVYAQGDAETMFYSRVTFAYRGRFYSRGFRGKRYKPRALVTKAKQLMQDIVEADENRRAT